MSDHIPVLFNVEFNTSLRSIKYRFRKLILNGRTIEELISNDN